jgi:hypothetical protein
MENTAFRIEPSNEPGLPTLMVTLDSGRTHYLHSRMSPSRESSSFSDKIAAVTQDTVIAIGCGLGYHLSKLSANQFVKRLIIIERINNLESAIRSNQTLMELFPSIHTTILTGMNDNDLEDELFQLIDFSEIRGIGFIEHPSSLRTFPGYYQNVRDIIDRVIRKKTGNLATTRTFARIFLRNCVKNFPHLHTMRSLSSLAGIWSGYPCVVVSSAPSIDHYISTIGKYRDRVYVLCIDSAYPVLRSAGIVPDICISVDPQPWIHEHLDGYDPSIPIITTLSARSIIADHVFLSLNTHPFAQILDHFYPGIGSCDSHSGTVAGDALCAAHFLGAARIFLAGLDFSFPDRKIYGKDTAYNKRFSRYFNNRLSPVETLHEKYIRKAPSRSLEKGIATRQSFLQFRDSFRSLTASLSGISIFHLRHGGLEIEGTTMVNHASKAASLFEGEKTITDRNTALNHIRSFPALKKLSAKEISAIFLRKELLQEALSSSVSADFTRDKYDSITGLIKNVLGLV